jgi:uncharacterized membrane protein HdeD (DUF308 family)
MNTNNLNMNDVAHASAPSTLSGNWWTFVVRGVLALILGVLAFVMPTQSLLVYTLVFGAFSFVDGVFGLIAAVRRISKGERWGWLMINGLLGIAIGIVVVVSPLVTTLVLAIFMWASIAFWSAFTGVGQVMAAIRLRKEIKGEFWLLLSGLISVAFSVVVLWMLMTRPIESLVALSWLLGYLATFLGVLMILLGMRLRKV